ncbi:MAG: ABC transporter permease, partial [Gammaproteobacteria bacterium]|nr:ABC transporter permease [Gammaproteobacteria bacterium]
ELVQENKVLHDVKFETKTTTYAKDAFKRFCKNKSSVVAAIIIGLLLFLSLLIPIVSIHDLSSPHLDQSFLQPRLFNAGSGFWDGTKKYTHIIYDPQTEAPAGFKKGSVVKVYKVEDEYLNDLSQYSFGGIYIFEGSKAKKSENGYYYDYFKLAKPITFTKENGISINVDFSDLEEYDSTLNNQATYRIVLQKQSGTDDYIVLRDWTDEISDFTFDISGYLEENNINTLSGYVRFDIKATTNTLVTPYDALYFDSIVYSTSLSAEDEANEELIELLDVNSITDANATKLLKTTDAGYWHSTGTTRVIKTHVSYWTFLYDHYEEQLGYTEGFEIGQTIMKSYVEKGYCEYDFEVGPSSFVKLSDKCPVEEVLEQKSLDLNGTTVINLVCNVQKYKYLNYNKMPKFLMGTDASGFDLLTRAFKSLRTSLAVAIIISGVCFMFGLVWGSISGYFGGNVDLAMERFCDILGGMPWIVLMTLAIIKFGNNLGTFAIASCITGWMGTAGITRTQFYRFKGREYILSSRTLGSSDIRLIFKHILPNSLGTIVTASVLRIPGVIFSEATLSYLGLGLKGVNSFGVILSENQSYINSYPYLILFPAVIISLLMITFNLFGNGLRDALNPSLKGSE